jgi:hypothetical protein
LTAATYQARRASSIFRTVSFWTFAAFVAIVALQLPPVPGVILMMFGAAFIAGALAHIFLVALLIEALIGRIPRILVLVPLLAYAGYYVKYASETHAIAVESTKLQNQNKGSALGFDPQKQALVLEKARDFIQRHDLPVVYEPKRYKDVLDDYVSYRRLSTDQCVEARSVWAELPQILRFRISVFDRTSGIYGQIRDKNVCTLALPQTPGVPTVSVTSSGDLRAEMEPGIHERKLVFTTDEATAATYYTASVQRLPSFPFLLIGCFLIDNPPAWRCDAGFWRTRMEIPADPNDAGDASRDDPVGAVLGIRRLSEDEQKTAPPAANFDALLDEIKSYPIRENAAKIKHSGSMFEAFVNFLNSRTYEIEKQGAWSMLFVDGVDKPPPDMAKALRENMDRLPPLRDTMIYKLDELQSHGVSTVSPWVNLVKEAMLLLPKSSWEETPGVSLAVLTSYFASTDAWRYGGLYVRAADAGARMLNFYARELKQHSQGTAQENDSIAMALCRIGHVDDATKHLLEDLYLSTRPDKPETAIIENVRRNSAFFLALLAAGDEQFVRDNPIVSDETRVHRWYDMVLAGKGRTSAGPNNCVEITTFNGEQTPALRPAIIWKDGDFIENPAP